MAMDISARTVHAVLHSVQEISGIQYNGLLARAGWSRFAASIPPVSEDLIATRAELERLFANVYPLLGEGLTRLFLRNYGRLLARQILAEDTGPRLQAKAPTPPEQRLAWFAAAMTQMSTHSWTPATLSDDPHAYYITFERCPLCAGVPNAHAPLCATMEALYSHLAQHLIGRRLRVVEVACAATGAPHCRVALYK
jgi:bacteriochlorophyll 4-vinyl reductase